MAGITTFRETFDASALNLGLKQDYQANLFSYI